MKKQLHIVHLYAAEMNIYGDTGNRIILQQRLLRRGFNVHVSVVGVGDDIPSDANLILGGGGQDKGQEAVSADLMQKSADLHRLRDAGVPMLMICGMYQLFGAYFLTQENKEVPGIGLVDAHTVASGERLVGNIVTQSMHGELIGYENHSGRTYLGQQARPLATVLQGGGNNGKDHTEGLIQQNIIGTYMHGPVLSKCPKLADWLLEQAILCAGYEKTVLEPLKDLDNVAEKAAQIAKQRPR